MELTLPPPASTMRPGVAPRLFVRDFAASVGHTSARVCLSTSRQAMQSRDLGRGRHALRRAGTFQEALRLRHAQRVLPRGVYRTRMSEVRGSWVCAAGLPGERHPNRSPERILAVRLPVSSG
jgi:hypothetical protein